MYCVKCRWMQYCVGQDAEPTLAQGKRPIKLGLKMCALGTSTHPHTMVGVLLWDVIRNYSPYDWVASHLVWELTQKGEEIERFSGNIDIFIKLSCTPLVGLVDPFLLLHEHLYGWCTMTTVFIVVLTSWLLATLLVCDTLEGSGYTPFPWEPSVPWSVFLGKRMNLWREVKNQMNRV